MGHTAVFQAVDRCVRRRDRVMLTGCPIRLRARTRSGVRGYDGERVGRDDAHHPEGVPETPHQLASAHTIRGAQLRHFPS
jgi:hypothetical protein